MHGVEHVRTVQHDGVGAAAAAQGRDRDAREGGIFGVRVSVGREARTALRALDKLTVGALGAGFLVPQQHLAGGDA